MERREFISKILCKQSTHKSINPPYFSGAFDCVDCDMPCVSICERELLSFENGKISFKIKEKGCNFCKACALACEDTKREVLSLKLSPKIEARTLIDTNSCLAWNNTICYNCADVCKFRAITFFGVFRPTINNKCVNCGECFYVCFKNSISMEAL